VARIATFSVCDYIASNGRTKDELGRIWKEVVVTWLWFYSRNLTADSEENHVNVSLCSLCPGRDFNRVPSECKSRALPLDHPVRYKTFFGSSNLQPS
jgi:hypothetical protein